MKIRNGFVSNSSSSSFIIISNGNIEQINLPEFYIIGQLGETEFGWQINKYNGFDSKVNFCYLQCMETCNKNYKDMLYKVIKDNTNVKEIESIIVEDYNDNDKVWGYIDHQSSGCEGKNLEMFKSEETLKNFLFNPSSYIHTDNDNH
jgi:hypothetical protein